MQGWCRWPGLVWHKRVVCRVPQFPQLIPGLSALSGQHDPSSNVISFILYPAFCTYQQYIALHYHYIGTYYYINITSIKSRSLSIIFTFSRHQIGKSGYLLFVYLGNKYSTFAENIFANHTALQPVQKLKIYPVTKL